MRIVQVVSLLASFLPVLAAPTARAAESPFHELWRQGQAEGFAGWELANVVVADGRLVLSPSDAATAGPRSGTARSSERPTSEPFGDLIPSWNAETPSGTWLEARLRARIDGRWTRWYVLGVWRSDGAASRHSVDGQDDADARVLTDTLALRTVGRAYQVELGLYSDHPDRSPAVSLTAVLASRTSGSAGVGGSERRAWGVTLDVPQRSQMIYPEGGEVWCSPTSTSMVMAYWAARLGDPGLDIPVPEVAAGTYDSVYRGNGNWPFNTAYAARGGLLGYVSRFSSLEQVERWIEAGVPVVGSLAWDPGQLANAAIGSTDGHLLVVVGFSEAGDVVVNDPAGDPRLGRSVRRVYDRGQFESLWLKSSGGAVYLIYPRDHPTPEGARGAW